MTVSKKLVLIATLCTTVPSAVFCMENNENSPKSSFDNFKATATPKVIEFKNNMEKHYQALKPYIYNPVGFAGACALSSILGPKVIVGTVVFGGAIAGSREIVKYLENAEKKAFTNENQ